MGFRRRASMHFRSVSRDKNSVAWRRVVRFMRERLLLPLLNLHWRTWITSGILNALNHHTLLVPLDMGSSPPLCRPLNPNLDRASAGSIDIWFGPRSSGRLLETAPMTLFKSRSVDHYSSLCRHEWSEIRALNEDFKMGHAAKEQTDFVVLILLSIMNDGEECPSLSHLGTTMSYSCRDHQYRKEWKGHTSAPTVSYAALRPRLLFSTQPQSMSYSAGPLFCAPTLLVLDKCQSRNAATSCHQRRQCYNPK